jgi:hypothetical protein
MKTILSNHVDEKQPVLINSTTERLLAEILSTLEKLLELLSSNKKIKVIEAKRGKQNTNSR